MSKTGKSGKLKKTSPGSYSTTGTTPADWGVDIYKPYESPGPTQRVETIHLEQAKRKPTTKNLPTSYKGTTATG